MQTTTIESDQTQKIELLTKHLEFCLEFMSGYCGRGLEFEYMLADLEKITGRDFTDWHDEHWLSGDWR